MNSMGIDSKNSEWIYFVGNVYYSSIISDVTIFFVLQSSQSRDLYIEICVKIIFWICTQNYHWLQIQFVNVTISQRTIGQNIRINEYLSIGVYSF